ncbi:hypothetical protein SOASR030_06570 [Leminorella grimontii]|uniref:Uncharacterized protein n=2 Tax=Leminorella grimontii TaxID=82981 RepID=A0AAV5MZ08_9GAMM|nr:hypothetical protein SOASR030_06570 [Leminorella grimontii]
MTQRKGAMIALRFLPRQFSRCRHAYLAMRQNQLEMQKKKSGKKKGRPDSNWDCCQVDCCQVIECCSFDVLLFLRRG